MKKPSSIRAIFLLTVFKILLSWGFFLVFSLRGTDAQMTQLIMYTAGAYVALAIPTFVFIHRRNVLGLRACLVLSVLCAIFPSQR